MTDLFAKMVLKNSFKQSLCLNVSCCRVQMEYQQFLDALFPTTDEEAEFEQFYEDLQGLLELTPKKKKDVLFILGDWNTKVGHQETWSNSKVWLGSTK